MSMVSNDAMRSVGARASRRLSEGFATSRTPWRIRKSTWRAGINEGGSNQSRLQTSQEGTLRSLGAEGASGSCAWGGGVWIRPCSCTPANTSNIMARHIVFRHHRQLRLGFINEIKKAMTSESSGSQKTRQTYHT